MLRRMALAVGLVASHLLCSGLAVVVIVGDLMSVGSQWVTTALSVALFLPILALGYAGLDLMEMSLPLALLVNSAINVGVILAAWRVGDMVRTSVRRRTHRCT